MKFALIPYTSDKLQDKYFFETDELGKKKFASDEIEAFWRFFYNKGDEIHTIDKYQNFEEVSFFLIFHVDWKWIWKIIRSGCAEKMVYCNAEPPTVMPLNCPEGFKKLKEIFPYILTWNRDWVDQKRIFVRTIPYHFSHDFGDVPYENKKLLTAITANKKSHYKDELYSERDRAYSYFEKELPDDFVFYGVGWDPKKHPGYGGCVNNKFSIYHQYKFALCLENTKNVKDYVTEKIYDCLCSGVVPIYGGASNIQEYVPEECYIDYFSFHSLEELKQFILKMDRFTYQKYLDAIDKFLRSDIQKGYTKEKYAKTIYEAVQIPVPFKISIRGICLAWVMMIIQCLKSLGHKI